MNDDLIDPTLTHEHQQRLQGWTVQRRTGLSFVIEPLIDNGPSQEALGLDEGSAEIVLDLARGQPLVGTDGLAGVDRASNRRSGDRRRSARDQLPLKYSAIGVASLSNSWAANIDPLSTNALQTGLAG